MFERKKLGVFAHTFNSSTREAETSTTPSPTHIYMHDHARAHAHTHTCKGTHVHAHIYTKKLGWRGRKKKDKARWRPEKQAQILCTHNALWWGQEQQVAHQVWQESVSSSTNYAKELTLPLTTALQRRRDWAPICWLLSGRSCCWASHPVHVMHVTVKTRLTSPTSPSIRQWDSPASSSSDDTEGTTK